MLFLFFDCIRFIKLHISVGEVLTDKIILIHLKDYTAGQQEWFSISLRIYRQWKSSPRLNGTLRTLSKQSILILTYKMYHNDLPSCMTAHGIGKLQPCYNLRNSLKLEIPPFKSNIKKYSIFYRGPVLWNHLPIECRNANSVKSFSRMINKLTLVRDIDFSNLFCRR